MLRKFLILIVVMTLVLNAEIIRKGRKGNFSFAENGESITLDKVNGSVKAYYDSVKVMGDYNYISGKLDGLQKEFFINGKIKAEYNLT
ncbi:MAG: hypothetical protein KAS62_04900, partial [Candidatus Delongbacteria bacterium]|nr:hypothetical protein [Candidatus Delongbacteria bacterium]